MEQVSGIVGIAVLINALLWILIVVAIWLFGQRMPRISTFRDTMLSQWRPALIIAVMYVLSGVSGGNALFNLQTLYALTIFSQAILGLTLARGLDDFEPLPVSRVIIKRERVGYSVVLMIVIAVLSVFPVLLAGTAGMTIGRAVFGEINRSTEVASTFSTNKWLMFFLFLYGGGFAEETPYRLLVLTLIWRLTRRRHLAVVLSAVIFGAYHLAPINQMYVHFWQFPISQFLASTLIGIVLGYLYLKRGYETAVLSHTLGDWIPFMLFVA